jgi:hypothetical protein
MSIDIIYWQPAYDVYHRDTKDNIWDAIKEIGGPEAAVKWDEFLSNLDNSAELVMAQLENSKITVGVWRDYAPAHGCIDFVIETAEETADYHHAKYRWIYTKDKIWARDRGEIW